MSMRRFVPTELLPRIRLAALILGEIALLVQLAQIGNSSKGPGYHHLSRIAILLLAVLMLVSYLRVKVHWWDVIVMPALVVLGGTGLIDPIAAIALAIALTVALSPYGSTWIWAARTVGFLIAVPTAVAVSPQAADRELGWASPTVLGVLPQILLVSVMMRGIYTALLRLARSSARDALVARAGHDMLGADTVDRVREIARRTAEELTALNPGLAVLVLRSTPDGLRVSNFAGLPGDLRGMRIPESVLADPAPLVSLNPGIRHWQVHVLESDRHMAIGGVRPVATEIVDALLTLAHQTVLAEAGRASHEELDFRANHDQLTQLPTRAKFFRAVAAAVDNDETGTVALLVIDLDDFKQVNDLHGHAAGDELLVQVAERIATVGGPGSMAARFGGDEFTLLLTGLSSPVQAEQIAELLCVRLMAPIGLTGATVKVGASIGVAVTAPGRTAGDLTRCADIAMYSAKAQGKNRIEVFHPDQHGEAAAHRTREKHLARAIECGEIVLRYRPQIAPGTGEPIAVETHAYWLSPKFGEIGADELTDLAAHTGNLADYGAYLIRTVCADLAGLPATVRFTLDVSGARLHDRGYGDMLLAMLAESAMDPARLILRVTGAEPISRLPRLLLDHGVRVVLDELNTRTASLMSLRAQPVHALTVDDGDHDGLALALAVSGVLGTGIVLQGVRAPGAPRPSEVIAVQGDAVAPEMTADRLAAWLATAAPPGSSVVGGAMLGPA